MLCCALKCNIADFISIQNICFSGTINVYCDFKMEWWAFVLNVKSALTKYLVASKKYNTTFLLQSEPLSNTTVYR